MPRRISRRVVIGVFGGGGSLIEPRSETYRLAEHVGTAIATAGAVLLCGGGSGVMAAAVKGAKNAGGATIGIMLRASGPKPVNIDLALFTGLRDGRNYVNVTAVDVAICLRGGAGTLSEIALSLKAGKPTLTLGHWQFLRDQGFGIDIVGDAESAVRRAFDRLHLNVGDLTDLPLGFPSIADQSTNRDQFERFMEPVK